jgi:hypothetical protein
MFGSLVLVFPTPHEGGALLIRHRGQEWSFDSATELSTAPPSSIGYVAFFSDVEHEIAPVVSGHRITLTYNLHFDDGPAPMTVPESAPLLQAANERSIRAAFEALLENPEFLPDGGVLGFGLQHVYQIKDKAGSSLEHIYGLLKGSDSALYRAIHSLGFEPVLYLYYVEEGGGAGLIDSVLDFESYGELSDPIKFLRYHGGIAVELDGENVTPVNWVTPVTPFNCLSSAYVRYGNEASLGMAYGDLCLIVHIGKMGERMMYPTVAQLKKEARDARERSPHRFQFLE